MEWTELDVADSSTWQVGTQVLEVSLDGCTHVVEMCTHVCSNGEIQCVDFTLPAQKS